MKSIESSRNKVSPPPKSNEDGAIISSGLAFGKKAQEKFDREQKGKPPINLD